MKKAAQILICMMAIFVLNGISYAQDQKQEIPNIIKSGLNAYKEKGVQEVLKIWLKGSPLEGSKEALSQSNSFKQIEDMYGKYESYEVLKVNQLGIRTQQIYLVMHYTNGPLFCRFLTYQVKDGSVIDFFFFHTDPYQILPPSVMQNLK